ncbi:TonB-dependent receptor [Colwellia sp. M166]|uniref:TonB-dependent receptor n=1 Tax=Colwellia sp. M166 TaxID=2583805 RepID=UPI00211EBC7F|nr:carboxypeptidase regulatory-like domain-containing protein [Colwellia sp. M166]UUO22146.1 TonB-dependent receptor [Colwellia sp. M166]|tara:strand:- start:17556 stop:20702 length:3147 start_codon:yes stop_codon:yes gene_type:complete
MMKNHRLSRITGAVVLALGLSTSAMAADTTSSVRGTIVGPNGQAAPNTKIMLIHQPSGTVTEVVTNETGAFNAGGLRVGGPYQIVIDSDKFQDVAKNDIFLLLGQTLRLNEQLNAAQNIETITVTGSQTSFTSNAGSSSFFGSDAIENSPSFNRDLKDILRQNPLATSLGGNDNGFSVAGSNPRFNSLNVDGVGLNDDFGLNGNGYPTQRSPISLDAIEQISIDTNPYNAKFGGFSGARINAVTKSGTNELHGGVFYEKTSDSWAGDYDTNNSKGNEVEGVKSDTWGAHLGGALIEDKLFFFANYESFEKPTVSDYGPEGSGKPLSTNLTLDEYNQIAAIASERYGIADIGGWEGNPKEVDDKILIKLDWNINDDHRAAFTFNQDESNSIRNVTDGSSTLNTSTNWYDYQQNMNSYALHLYSDWNSDLTTEFAVSYKDVESISGVATRDYGKVSIDRAIDFGPDNYRHANALETKTWRANFDAEYLVGDHKLGFGVQYERNDIFNMFAEATLGTWTFDSIDDFAAGNAELYYGNAPTNNQADTAASLVMGTYSFYVQDDWAFNSDIDVSFGLRYERIFSDDTPSFNAKFYDRYGYGNQENLDGTDIWLPRVGMTWYASDDLTVRGGFGLFSGGKPNVWISNSYSKTGINYVTNTQDYTDLTSLAVPQDIKDSLANVTPDGETNVIDSDFETPSEWRYSIGFDYNFDSELLGDNWTWSGEYIYVDKQDSLAWRDLNRQPSGEVTKDGRIIYEPFDATSPDNYDILLTNADRDGYSNVISTSLYKSWENGLDMNISYTNQDVVDGNTGTSSQAASNYKYNVYSEGRNVDALGTGNYEIEHSLKITLGYTKEFFEGYNTRVNLFFERRSGRPFGWVLGTYRKGDLGDQDYLSKYNAKTPYIPSGADDPNVAYKNGMTYADLMADYVNPAGLAGYAGGFVDKNSSKRPWLTTMDLSIQQDIPGLMKGHKGTLTFTVQNLANLINKDWGHVYSPTDGDFNKEFANAEWNDDGQIVYSPNSRSSIGPIGSDNSSYDIEGEDSVWYIKVGVRYTF